MLSLLSLLTCAFMALPNLLPAQNVPDSTLSAAHGASQKFVIDPAYDALALKPASDSLPWRTPWIYGDGQLEACKIDRVVEQGFAANRHVDYLRNYGRVSPRICFRHAWPTKAPETFTFQTNAETVKVMAGGSTLFQGPASSFPQMIVLPPMTGGDFLQLEMTSTKGEPAALLIENGLFRTGELWESSVDGKTWSTVSAFPQTKSGLLPNQSEEPVISLPPVHHEGDLYDFGVTLLGRPVFRCDGIPGIVTGESIPEAQAPDSLSESHLDLVQRPDGTWTSKNALGFRYVRITGGTPTEVHVEEAVHPVRYRGAFACSDDRLTQIWMHSALTLRTCMQQLMIDGVKRDRMPWIGDQASNVLANAYTFGDAEIVRESFTALGRPSWGYINGIVDYPLWWVINLGQFQKYFDDPVYLQKELPHLQKLLSDLAAQTDADGLLKPPGKPWIFIDWGVHTDRTRTSIALQMLWYGAQRTGAKLAAKAGDATMAQQWKTRADALAIFLRTKAWNESAHAWQEYLESPETNSPYPNLLSVFVGLAQPEQLPGIRQNLLDHPVQGTPFMRGFGGLALAEAGAPDQAIAEIRDYWGGMLNHGATTFWEDFKPGEKNDYDMYDRPFGRSLCHAWASGPAMLLPKEILGIRPLTDGWKDFAVAPHLGDLKWANASVTTPSGNIEVEADEAKTVVKIPAGLTLVWEEKRYPGPQRVEMKP